MLEQREELRLALVMNGGVSLAVWMGGVSNEIFRLVTGQHPVYKALLDMTQTTARVDVISGTSAGGLNGAALSLALLYGGDFSRLREVWFQTGAFESLMRPPLGENPGSLLQGEDFFLPEIQQAFTALAQAPRPIFSPNEMPIDLRLTTTLLRGEQGHSVDDLGTAIHDVDYRAQFHFRHAGSHRDFDDRQPLVGALSRAARSTSSFPFAFEPSAVKGLGDLFVDSQDRPIAASQLPGTGEVVDRFVVDGGVLDNKPFRGALRSMFAMPTERGVRRVLAYINPDPGDGTAGTPRKDPPPLSSVLAASLFGIPQSQTIADQLAEIQEHNDHVRTRRESVFSTVLRLSPQALDRLPGELFSLYRQRRLESTFDDFVYKEVPAATRRLKLSPSRAIAGKRGRAWLLGVYMGVPWRGWIPAEWPADLPLTDAASEACLDEHWEWGLYPVEFAIKVVLDVLRRTQSLSDLDPQTKSMRMSRTIAPHADGSDDLLDWNDPPHPNTASRSLGARLRSSARSMAGQLGLIDETLQTWDREAVRGLVMPPSDPQHPWLAQAWRGAYRCASRTERMRREEQPTWERNAERLANLLDSLDAGREPKPGNIDQALFTEMFAFLVTPKRRGQCGLLMRLVARVLLRVAKHAQAMALRVARDEKLREDDRQAGEALHHFLAWLVPHEGNPALCGVVHRLMQLEVIEHVQNPHDALDDDCMIELAQISGNASSPLGGPTEASKKLLGLQLAHFGAFYKQCWRANDWTFGRLDGGERMVKILMNPDRLRRFFPDSLSARNRIQSIAVDEIASPVLRAEVKKIWAERGYADKLLAELAFLDNPMLPVPYALPVATEVVTLRLHFGILREEIDPLLAAIAADRSQGADALGKSEAFLRRFSVRPDDHGKRTLPFSPEQARAALADGLIAGKRGENLLDEAGSDLFTRTLAHLVATLQGVLSSKSAKLGPVSVFFAGLKIPVLGFYFIARGLTRQSRTSAALHGGILAIGIALVATQLVLHQMQGAKLLPGEVISFGWALLAYGLLFSIASSPRFVGPLSAGVLVALTFVLRIDVSPLLLVLGALVLLWLSIQEKFLAPLQWVLGMAAIFATALWSRGATLSWPLPFSSKQPVDQIAGLVCLVLLLAAWQASTWAKWAESATRRWFRKLRK